YLGETIEYYERAVDQHQRLGSSDSSELEWAHGVLANYFAVVDASHPAVAAARQRFEQTAASFHPGEAGKVPYARAEGHTSAASYEDLLSLAQQRRSVRWFTPDPVPRELIDK